MISAQKVIVRMLFDPAFALAARENPDEVLADLPPELRKQLAAIDPRALVQDKLRRRRALRTLSEEFKGATTLALAEKSRLSFLEEFFSSSAFHQSVAERGSMTLAFAAWLAEQPWQRQEMRGVLAIETALAWARRDKTEKPGIALAAGVIPISVTRGAMAALQSCEKYLFEVGLMPAVALCDDAPPLELPEYDDTPLELVTVALESGVTLVEIDHDLAQLMHCLPGSRENILREARARGVADPESRLQELLSDEIAHE
jgi:hypothetical protein